MQKKRLRPIHRLGPPKSVVAVCEACIRTCHTCLFAFLCSSAMVNKRERDRKAKKKASSSSKTSSAKPSAKATVPKLKLQLSGPKPTSEITQPVNLASPSGTTEWITPPPPIPPEKLDRMVRKAVGRIVGPGPSSKDSAPEDNELEYISAGGSSNSDRKRKRVSEDGLEPEDEDVEEGEDEVAEGEDEDEEDEEDKESSSSSESDEPPSPSDGKAKTSGSVSNFYYISELTLSPCRG